MSQPKGHHSLPERARRAAAVCELAKEHDYPEWVVTTAFYSAMSWLEHKMFPLEYSGSTVANFVAYYTMRTQFKGSERKPTKRHIMLELVYAELPAHGPHYEWLMTRSMAARYETKKIRAKTAQTAHDVLTKIVASCDSDA